MKELQEIIQIIDKIRQKITENTDVVSAGYDSPQQLQEELDTDLTLLKSGNTVVLGIFNVCFLPTAAFQEIAESNGWGSEFLLLSEKFDELYTKINHNKKG